MPTSKKLKLKKIFSTDLDKRLENKVNLFFLKTFMKLVDVDMKKYI